MKKFTFFSISGIILLMLFAIRISAQTVSYPDAWGQHGFSLQRSHSEGVDINFSITGFTLEDILVNGEMMKNISLDGNFLFNDEGAPNLPGNGKILAMPQGSTASVEIVSSRTETFQGINLAPAPRIPKDTEKGPLSYRKDPKIYSQDAFYPQSPVKTSAPMKIRGVDAVMLGITPFRYNPATKELIVYRDLQVKVKFEGGNGRFGDDRLRSRWWDPILEDAIYNFSALPKVDYNQRYLNPGPTEETGAEYLIITPDGADFQQYADSIKRFRTEQGILTMVKTLTQVGGNTTTAIESYINNAYSTWTIPPAAILLLGDYGTDITSTVISPIYNSYCASDNIYGDVDGDQLPDIVMARITANNLAQLQVMVSKFLKYERNPPTSASFYAHPITALGWQTERWFQICSETVGGFWKNVLGKTPVRINAVYGGDPTVDPWSSATNTSTVVSYFGPSGLNYIPATPQELGGFSGGNAAGINTAINNGSFMLQHRDHGMETGWGEPSYVSSNIDGLTNTDLTYIMSINCLTGKYNYSSEVFAEKFHRYTYGGANAGALGIMAATEVSYSFVNDAYVWGLYDNLWPNFMPAYGTTPASRGILPAFGNAAGKLFLYQSSWPYNTGDKEVTYHLFHHHGDAFLTVYSEVPQLLSVTHSPVLYAGMSTFTVTANAGAYVALTVNGVIIGTATATGSPQDIPIISQVPPDQVIVTITKQNYYRYRSVVNVVPASGPYVVYTSHSVTDLLPGGNNNGLADYGESAQITVTVKNVGIEQAANVTSTLSTSDSYITITDNSESFGNIDPNATVTKASAFTFSIANNIPDQHVVSFTLTATNGTSTWVSHFNIVVNAPVLSIGTMTVLDNGAGCNNNGILDPGETASLVIANTNTGHSSLTGINGNLAIVGGSSTWLTLNSTASSIGTLAAGGSGNTTFNVIAGASTPIGTPVNLQYSLSGGAYSTQETKQVVIGLIPDYVMSTTTVSGCVGHFYDPGGASATYSNSQDFTMTFNPGNAGSALRFIFNSFDLEANTTCSYDYLKIYDGNSISATLLGTYCGTTSPGTITANNATGSLTFVFHSDGSVTNAGWDASFSCISGLVLNPSSFAATAAGQNQINLSWTKNASNHNVMVLYSTSNVFGTPVNGTNYTAGTVLGGGGTILYSGNGNTFSHTSLNPSTTYYYKAFSYDGTITYSTGLASSASTLCGTVILPFGEAFAAAALPGCWATQISGTGATNKWTVSATANAGGTANEMKSTYQNISPGITRLVTPPMNTTGMTQLNLSFRHMLDAYGTGATLRVQSSTDGTNWTNEAWSVATTATNIAAATVNTTILNNLNSPNTMIAFTIEGNLYQYDYWYIDDVSVTGNAKTVNLSVLLESLYATGGIMRKAQGASGDQYTGNTADQITVELHSSANYSSIMHTVSNVSLTTGGAATITVPATLNGSYYITIKHRNSVETTSAAPVSFSAGTINYNFNLATQAYGSNLAQTHDGHWVIYAGEANQDGLVDAGDLIMVDNSSSTFGTGYIPEDTNGDGMVDATDLILVDNKSSNFVGKLTP